MLGFSLFKLVKDLEFIEKCKNLRVQLIQVDLKDNAVHKWGILALMIWKMQDVQINIYLMQEKLNKIVQVAQMLLLYVTINKSNIMNLYRAMIYNPHLVLMNSQKHPGRKNSKKPMVNKWACVWTLTVVV